MSETIRYRVTVDMRAEQIKHLRELLDIQRNRSERLERALTAERAAKEAAEAAIAELRWEREVQQGNAKANLRRAEAAEAEAARLRERCDVLEEMIRRVIGDSPWAAPPHDELRALLDARQSAGGA